MSAPGLHLFNIPLGVPFARALAEGAIAMAGAEPFALADMLVLVPTRRAARTLREAFAAARGGAALGPNIRALGDIGEDDIVFDAASDDLMLPPAMAPLRRRLLLATLVQRWAHARGGSLPMAQAVNHATELARLLDEVTTQNVELAKIETLVTGQLAQHWEQVVKFLDIIAYRWPEQLDKEGVIEPADHRDRLLRGIAARLRAAPPKAPVIAAGSTGSIPATAELLKVVAGLPNGAVVLPGLDAAMDEESWTALDPAHAQYGLRELLKALGAVRDDVRMWPTAPSASLAPPARHLPQGGRKEESSSPTGGGGDPGLVPGEPEGAVERLARVRFLSEALRPPPTTDAWRALVANDGETLKPAFDNIALVEAATPREEALVIAVALREALEEPNQTAALVTPDRGLARRVAAELTRWDIAIDDSAGLPLSRTPAGTFLALIARAAEQFSPVPLLAVLKHPLACGQDSPAWFRHRARQLDELALRGLRPEPGLDGVLTRLRDRITQLRERRKKPDDYYAGLIDWFADVAKRFSPLAEATARKDVPLAEIAATHIQTAEALAGGAANLWRNDDGSVAAGLLSQFIAQSDQIVLSEGREYGELFRDLAETCPVRPAYGRHPRLAILGTQEARLLHFDFVVLGGLNEGTWPGDAGNDPFLSRRMRVDLGLEAPERRIGLAAHDFVSLAAAPRVLMTRATKQDGAPTVPSRWLQRITQLAVGLELAAVLKRSDHLRHARTLDSAPRVERVRRPAYVPPARLAGLSVTDVETWLRDPYAIYAKHILQLRVLRPLEEEPGPRERGIAVHDALEAFHNEFPAGIPEDAEIHLLRHGEAAFRKAGATSEVMALWQPRFVRAVRWFIAAERERRALVARSVAEAEGKLALERDEGLFTLTGRADRIDMLPDGSASVVDYKTGKAPAHSDIAKLSKPQLPLEAAMVLAGAFEDITAGSICELIHVRLGGREPPGDTVVAKVDANAIAKEALERLVRRITQFDRGFPFRSRLVTFNVREAGDYDQLARVREWAIVEDDPLAGPQ